LFAFRSRKSLACNQCDVTAQGFETAAILHRRFLSVLLATYFERCSSVFSALFLSYPSVHPPYYTSAERQGEIRRLIYGTHNSWPIRLAREVARTSLRAVSLNQQWLTAYSSCAVVAAVFARVGRFFPFNAFPFSSEQ